MGWRIGAEPRNKWICSWQGRRIHRDDCVDLGSGIRPKNDLHAVKSAEISLAKSMAQQLAKDNIRVNSVATGSIRVPGGSWDRHVQEDPIGMGEFVKRELPFGRSAGPRRSGPWSRFLSRLVPAGSAGPVFPLTAASHAP